MPSLLLLSLSPHVAIIHRSPIQQVEPRREGDSRQRNYPQAYLLLNLSSQDAALLLTERRMLKLHSKMLHTALSLEVTHCVTLYTTRTKKNALLVVQPSVVNKTKASAGWSQLPKNSTQDRQLAVDLLERLKQGVLKK